MKKTSNSLKGVVGALMVAFALLACGDDDNGSGTDLSDVVATVTVSPAAPAPLASLGETVTLSAAAAASNGAAIAGKTFSWASDDEGVATVSASGVVTAVANGGATITATTDGVSGGATVTVQQIATQLAFRTIAGGTVRTAIAPVQVETQDAGGNVVAGASTLVTLALGNNPGNLVLHTSGVSGLNRFIELVDPATPAVLSPELSTNEGIDENLALEYDPGTRAVLAADRAGNLHSIDLPTGAMDSLGATADANRLKGIAFESSSGDLLAVQRNSDDLVSVDPLNGDTALVGRLVIAGDSIIGFTGLDEDPTTGTMYGVAILDEVNRTIRNLVSIDVASLTATNIATLSEEGVAAITFLSDGTALAVTGDGSPNPETLWSVNLADGMMTSVLVMGNGDDGESIEAIPARLTGTFMVAAVSGVATFSDLQLDGSGVGYTLTAAAAGLSGATSAAFDVSQ